MVFGEFYQIFKKRINTYSVKKKKKKKITTDPHKSLDEFQEKDAECKSQSQKLSTV